MRVFTDRGWRAGRTHVIRCTPVFTDSVRPVIDAGLVEPVEADTALTRDVHLKIAPQP